MISKKMPMKLQSDAVRVAILNKYGGMWIDADTIILNDKAIKFFKNFELSMVWEENKKFHYIAFIYASKNSSIMNEWQEKIIDKVTIYNNFILDKFKIHKKKKIWKKINNYDYL